MKHNPLLKPCPFCAWPRPVVVMDHGCFDGVPGWRIECKGPKCHAMSCWWHSESETRTRWNMRAAVERGEETKP
jgi:hypothetical protein